MRLIFFGDVVGKRGCEFLASKISGIKREYGADVIIVNGENSAVGNGVTPASAKYLFSIGADVITTGNHCFQKKESFEIFEESEFLLRPVNFPKGNPGRGYCVYDMGRASIAVVNLMGIISMSPLDNPFFAIDEVLKEIKTPNIFVDFHAEATSEKKAMGYYLAGRVTAVIGTHTHVQTADEAILDGHTAYITDAGMCGAEKSVLGIKTELALKNLKYRTPVSFKESEESQFINAVIVDFDEKHGKSAKINRLIIR